jgi:diguanylate cyclase (GGDEF)-like protein/PAS domain S-box-containing protein
VKPGISELQSWFAQAQFAVIAFEPRTTLLHYANAAAESLLLMPMASLSDVKLNDWVGLSLGDWLEQWHRISSDRSAMRLRLHQQTSNEAWIDLRPGAPVPGHEGLQFALVEDVTSKVRVEGALDYRKRLESLILSLSTHFLNLHGERVDGGIQYALRSLGHFAEADRSYIFELSPDGKAMTNSHEWCAPGVKSEIQSLQGLPTQLYPWFMDQLRAMKAIHIPRIRDIPAAALAEKREWEREGIQSLLIVPMEYRGAVRGFLGFDSVRKERAWADDIIGLLRVAGELLINALERKRGDQALDAISSRYRSLFENAVEGIFQTTPAGHFVDANPAFARILGFESPHALLKGNEEKAAEFYPDPSRRQELMRHLERDGRIVDFEGQARKRDGSLIWLSLNARAVHNRLGQLEMIEGSAIDITQRKQMEAQLVHDALHDSLTGLPNRNLLVERLDRALHRLRRKTSPGSCVLLLDLDSFKTLNDGLGHAHGDKLLQAVKTRLEKVLVADATLARLGGDEFAILLEDMPCINEPVEMAHAIQREFEAPFAIEGQEVYASTSIGVALANPDYANPDEWLRDADTAMHQAKNDGRARHAVFDASMHDRAVQRLHLENDLRRALERQEFFLVYQPIVELKAGTLTGFEALIRWRHPQRGIVPPIEFIPITEETGLIIPLGKWVLEEACRQLREWQVLLPQGCPLTMSVNISGRQFEGLLLAGEIENICKTAGIDPRQLKLEITESAIIRNPEAATAVLKDLQAKGFQLSLDDFGTGYSSLSYLHRFPFHNLKIDRSFVMKLEKDEKNDEIVKAINGMARNLGMDVTAEGVETQDQWDLLRHLETPFGQGYFFSKPLIPEDAKKWIEKLAQASPSA